MSSTDYDRHINKSCIHTLSLIHQIEQRKKYLGYCGTVFFAWLFLFIPLGLHYLSVHPDSFSLKASNVVLEGMILRSESKILALVPTSIDDSVAAYVHHLIGGTDSVWYNIEKNILGLNTLGTILFYFAGLTAILFASQFLKYYHIS